MTQPSTLCAARKMLDRLAAPLVARLPLDVAPNRDGPIDRLRPRIAIEPSDMMTSVRLVRTSHVSEGGTYIIEDVNLYLLDKEEVASRIQAMLDEVGRLLAQDRAIIESGGDPERPRHRWFTCHPFMLDAARHWDWDLDEMVAPSEITQTDGSSMIVRNDSMILTPLLTAIRDGAMTHCGRYQSRRHLLCGHLSVLGPDGKEILAQYSDQDGPAVRIPGRRLPETLLTALAGRRVRDVVDDARLGPMLDLTIASAHSSSSGTTLEIESAIASMERGKKT